MALVDSRCESSFIEHTGFNMATFRWILSKVSTFRERRGRGTRGGPKPRLGVADDVGLVLWWYCSKTEYRGLCPVFGVVTSAISKHLRRTMADMVKVFRREPVAQVVWPNEATTVWLALVRACMKGNRGYPIALGL